MGFGEQLNETLNRLPDSKQMVMFSATLPKLLVDFARAGLGDPVLIRLDVESKLPEGLTLKFVHCRPDERYSALISLLKYVIPSDAQTVVFAGTQHHVELISYVSVSTSRAVQTTLMIFVCFCFHEDFDRSQHQQHVDLFDNGSIGS